MAIFKKMVQYGMGPAIRLIKGGANQKTTQGMIQSGATTSKGGVETMKTMGTMPPKPPVISAPYRPAFKPRQIGPQLPPKISYGTLPKTVKTPPIGGAMKSYIEGFKTASKANKTIKDADKFMSTSKKFKTPKKK